MATRGNKPEGSVDEGRVPPRQHNFEDALALAVSKLAEQSPEQLIWLGACREDDRWVLPVLDDRLSVGLRDGSVRTASGTDVGRFWRVLTLHYLAVSVQPPILAPTVAFADLAAGRAYAPVYQGRVIGRLCSTAGRDVETLLGAGESLGGTVVPFGDLGLEFQVYPRVRLRLIYYAGDDELTPSATLLLPPNIESFFCVEDVVVLSEGLVARLGGRSF